MAEKAKKLNQYVPLQVLKSSYARGAANMLKDSLESYEKAQKENPDAKDGNYGYLYLESLVQKLKGLEEVIKQQEKLQRGA